MAESIFKLNNLHKSYILGTNKNARKAQSAIQKLQKKYERLAGKDNADKKQIKQIERKLQAAQAAFTQENYIKSYKLLTDKTLKPRKQDRGTVVHALRGVSVDIRPGELVAIMGPSGSGKSTLLNMLGLLDQPTSGNIYLNGKDVSRIKDRHQPDIRSRQLGFVFQAFNLIPSLTALENVMLPLRYSGIPLTQRRKIAKDILARVGLDDRLGHTPNELSGGQRQRVAIARSIVNEPTVVFGDELTGELDSKMTASVMDLVVRLNKKGQTFIIVTHNPEVAQYCRRIIHMKDGRIEKETNR